MIIYDFFITPAIAAFLALLLYIVNLFKYGSVAGLILAIELILTKYIDGWKNTNIDLGLLLSWTFGWMFLYDLIVTHTMYSRKNNKKERKKK